MVGRFVVIENKKDKKYTESRMDSVKIRQSTFIKKEIVEPAMEEEAKEIELPKVEEVMVDTKTEVEEVKVEEVKVDIKTEVEEVKVEKTKKSDSKKSKKESKKDKKKVFGIF